MDAPRRAGRPGWRDIVPSILLLLATTVGAAPGDGDVIPPATATITETSVAHFSAGTHSGTAAGETDATVAAGQLRLQPLLADVFAVPDLGSVWRVTRPGESFAPLIAGGVLDVQERDDAFYEASAIESWSAYEADVVLTLRAAIHPGSAFVNVGFMSSTTDIDQWAYFGTRGTGDGVMPVIFTSVRGEDGETVNLPTAVTLGEWHDFAIAWIGDTLEFRVDGVVVDTRTGVDLSLPQRVALYKSDASDSPLLVDWVRVTPHATTAGDYISTVHDAGTPGAPWTTLRWQGDLPAGTAVGVATRSGETPAPDAGWSGWSDIAGEAVTSPPGRYAQYRLFLETVDAATSPVIDEVAISYTYPDADPPAVLATIPAAGATAADVTAPIVAIFSEALDPATVTAASFSLWPAVAADVSYDPERLAATLSPTLALAPGTTYEARLTAAVTDLDGNPLAAHAWSFRTAPADLAPPTVVAASPAAGAIDVVAGRPIVLHFDEALDAASVTAASVVVAPAGGAPVAALVSLGPAGRRVTLAPQAPLARATLHEMRLTTALADRAGNHLAEDAVWTFTTSYLDAVDVSLSTTDAFAAGTLSGVVVSELDNTPATGQLRLASRLDDRFDQPQLADQWEITNPPGHVPVIEDGILDVQAYTGGDFDRSAIQSIAEFGPGVVLEARAMFVIGSPFIDVGFDANTLTNPQYAWFSSQGTGGPNGDHIITARVREYDRTTVGIEVPAQYGQWHVFKIIWTVGRVDFYLDGELVATHTDVLFTQPMHAAFYKTNDPGSPFYIDWIRITPYTGNTGSMESPVLDAGIAGARWRELSWLGEAPAGTNVSFAVRTGEVATPGPDWSVWSPATAGTVASPPGRYAQLRADLLTTDPLASPVLETIRLGHTTSADLEPPTVTAAEPDQGATGVAPTSVVRATFSEPLHPATVTEETVTLLDDDGAAVPATVTYSEATRTVTLTPASELRGGKTYAARLSPALADTAANRLAGEERWTFTTLALPGSAVPPATVLHPAVPNPFNPVTRFSFELGPGGPVHMRAYTVDGRFVRTLIRADLEGGRRYWKTWDGRDEEGRGLPAGTYLIRLETADGVQTSKVMLVR